MNRALCSHTSECTVLTVTICSVDHVPLLVEPQDVVSNTGRSATLHLVFVSKQFLSRRPTSVVQLSVGEDTEESALTGINITHYRHSGGGGRGRGQ